MGKQSKISILVLITLMFTMSGCGIERVKALIEDAKILSELGSRQVESVVIPVEKGGEETQTPDLLILNRRLDPPPVKCYLSYAYKTEDRWKVRWEQNLGSDIVGYSDVTTLVDKARVYVIVGPTVQAFKLSDGTVEWETSLSDEVAATCRECATLAKDRLIVLASDLVLQGVDVDSGEVAWSYELRTSLDWQVKPIVLDEGNKVAIVDQTDSDVAAPGGLYVFHAGDGEQLRSIIPQCADIPFRVGLPVFIDKKGQNAYFTLSLSTKHCIQGWNINEGKLLWESLLPEEISKGPLFFNNPHLDSPGLLADDALYYGSGGPAKAGKLIHIDLSDGAINLLLEDSKYAITPLFKDDAMLLVQASRTKGSEQHELWGVNISSGETLWRYELQGTDLMGWGSNNFGAGTWTIAPAGDRLAVIQVLSEGAEALLDYVLVDILNIGDGTIATETKSLINDVHWMGTALTKGRAYLSIRNLYSVDLETGTVDWEWPLSAPPADLIDPLGE
jgi:outer membrane protein assembly factor BamB